MLNGNFITTPANNSDLSNFIEKIRESEHSRLVDLNYLELLKQPYKIRVAIYLRVSTLKQAEDKKVSIPEQKDSIIQEIKNHHDWEIIETYNEGGSSGKRMETRQHFEKMSADAKLGMFDLIIGWSTDRLARNSDEMTAYRAEMRMFGVQISTVMEPSHVLDPRTLTLKFKSQDKIVNFLNDWKAEADNETRVARFSIGKLGKAKKGVNPCKVGYGYKKKITYIDGDPNKKQEEDVVVENQATIVREIYTIYDQLGWGFRNIANKLNQDKTPSPNGGLWSYSTIKYILQNPSYTGLVRWGWRLSESKKSRTRLQQGHEGIIVKGNHTAIIDQELFQRVQDKMKIRAKLGGRAIASKGLLSGLIYCGTCNGHSHLSTAKAGKYPAWSAYMCTNNAHHGKSACPIKYLISKRKAEEAVIQKIKELASNPEAQVEFIKQSQSSKKGEIKAKIKLINDTFEKNKEGRERIKNLLITQDFDSKMVAEFKDQLTKYDVQEIRQTKELEQLQKELRQESETEKLTKETILSLMNFDKIWETADIDKKKMLLATLIKKIVISNEKDIYIEFNNSGSNH